MPSRPRRLNSRSVRLPIRTTSYRSAARESATPSPDADLLTHVLTRKRPKTVSPSITSHDAPTVAIVTADRLSMVLPIPPSINQQYATVNGRRVLSSAGRTYKAQVGQQVWIALAQSPVKASLMKQLQSGPLAFSIRFFFTTALRRDVDSGLKIAQDALCEGLGVNDNRIVETHLYKQVDKLHPRIEVSLTLAAPPSSAL